MLEGLRQTKLRATHTGSVAARALRDGARGRVHSVFERSAYLCIRDRLICLGPPTLGNGPLNLLCEPWPCEGARRLHTNGLVRVEQRLLQVGHALTVSLAGAEVWSPKPTAAWDPRRLGLGLVALAGALPKALPEEGLAPLLHASGESLDDEPPVAAAARAAAEDLGRLVARSVAGGACRVDAEPITALIGLGPGLTPSGDDFLGGALVALSLLGQNALRVSLWRALHPLVATQCNEISGAHLAAAAAGLGSGALHELLDAVIAGQVEPIPGLVKAVASIGHTSGLDALAGATIVLRAASSREAIRTSVPA